MHKLLSTFAFTVAALSLANAQNVPQYVLTEHFTNSRCSVCASRNPAFYTLIGQHESEVHHLSVHPSVPYSNCVFYLANPTENNQRTGFYDISGTPRVVLNGTLVPLAAQLLPAATLNAALGQTSPVYVQVTETGSTVNVRIHTVGTKPAGDYVLYTAFAEKEVNYNAPNGENLHHDVFRDMLSNIDGDPITLPETGQSVAYQYTKTTSPDWNPAQMYGLAWVQNTQDKVVLNSGTKFDPVVSGLDEAPQATLQISPNPASDRLYAVIPDGEPVAAEIFAVNGSLVQADYTVNGNQVVMDVATLESGIYFVRVKSESGTFTGKIVIR